MSSGIVTQIIGAVIDVEFDKDNIPKVYEALIIDESKTTLEVQQQLGKDQAQIDALQKQLAEVSDVRK